MDGYASAASRTPHAFREAAAVPTPATASAGSAAGEASWYEAPEPPVGVPAAARESPLKQRALRHATTAGEAAVAPPPLVREEQDDDDDFDEMFDDYDADDV